MSVPAQASAPFVATLRSRREAIRLAPDGARVMTVRVQVPEIWDVVRIEADADESVRAVKQATLDALKPTADPELYVMKLRGFEVLDEAVSLSGSGAIDGSIFLLTHRRRRPAR